MRRGKVSGYRDYFSAEESTEIDALIDSRLSPVFGYGETETTKPAETA
jgi:hypothetical protein